MDRISTEDNTKLIEYMCEHHTSMKVMYINLDCSDTKSAFLCQRCSMESQSEFDFLLRIDTMEEEKTDEIYFKSPFTTKTQLQNIRKIYSKLKPSRRVIDSIFKEISQNFQNKIKKLDLALQRESINAEKMCVQMFGAYNKLIGKQQLKDIIKDRSMTLKEKDTKLKELLLENRKNLESNSLELEDCFEKWNETIFKFETSLSLLNKMKSNFETQIDCLLKFLEQNELDQDSFSQKYSDIFQKIDTLMLHISNKFNQIPHNQSEQLKNDFINIAPIFSNITIPPIQNMNSLVRQVDDSIIQKCKQIFNQNINCKQPIKVVYQVYNMTFGKKEFEENIENKPESLRLLFDVEKSREYRMDLAGLLHVYNTSAYAYRMIIRIPIPLKQLTYDSYITIGFRQISNKTQLYPINIFKKGVLLLDESQILEANEFENEGQVLEIRWVPNEDWIYIETKSKFFKISISHKDIDHNTLIIEYNYIPQIPFTLIFESFQVIQKEDISKYSKRLL